MNIASAVDMIGTTLQAGLLGVLLWRRLPRRFPFFFAYTLYSILAIGCRFWTRQYLQLYYVVYSVTDIIYGALALFAMVEAFRDALDSLYRRYGSARTLRLLLLPVVAGASVWGCIYHPHIQGGPYACFAGAVYSFLFCVRYIEISVFALYLWLKRRYTFHQYNAGIISGFGLYALIALFTSGLHMLTHFSLRFESLYRALAPGAYLGAAGVWFAVFLIPVKEVKRQPPDENRVRQAADSMRRDLEIIKRNRNRGDL